MSEPVHRRQKVNFREEMPICAAFIDDMREVFGAACIDQSIRNGMQGFATFYACENGHELGTKADEPRYVVTVAQMELEKLVVDVDVKSRRRGRK